MLKHPCHYFNSTGKCRFGKHCKFLHNIDPNLEDNLTTQQQDGILSESSGASSSVSHNQASTLATTTDQHEGLTQTSEAESFGVSSPQEIEICKFYARSSFCRYGNRCKYRHVRKKVTSELRRENRETADHGFKQDAICAEDSVQNERVLQEPAEVNHNSYGQEVEHQKDICPFYAKSRFCRYGNRCKYRHVRKKESAGFTQKDRQAPSLGQKHEKDEGIFQGDTDVNPDVKQPLTAVAGKERQKGPAICRFYKKGSCQYGRKCRNLHPQDASEQIEINPKPIITKPPTSKPAQILSSYTRDSVNFELQRTLRQTEIQQLKRRFPVEKLNILQESAECSRFWCSIAPTDPDWPYDARTFVVEVTFNEDYPLKLFKLDVPVDQDLPETVRRYIAVTVQDWVDKKQQQLLNDGVIELVFRPFLRWFDRNLETIVTEALQQLRRELTAKAAGFEFIPATKDTGNDIETPSPTEEDQEENISDESSGNTQEGTPIVYRKRDINPDDEVYTGPERSSDESQDDSGEDSNRDDANTDGASRAARPQIDIDTPRRGTEMSFKNMQLWYCTTVMLQKLHVAVQCDRCKNRTEFSTPPNRVNRVHCNKCNSSQLAVFRPVLAHSYSSTFGYLDLDGCQAFDVVLQDCVFAIGCIGCNKDVVVKTFAPGKVLEMWCRGCHTKMKFATETVKFNKLIAAGVDTSAYSGRVHEMKVDRLRRAPKDSAIQEGKALPDNGACKHYKKSFRWLRFPCCGKTYPCDVCHNDKENHEMKYANRMICGFCCREQPYAAEKACLGCGSSLTKVRSTHWEGGRGCRDKLAMSKDDKQKFANLNKTVSKKSVALKEAHSGKKNTKLRHT